MDRPVSILLFGRTGQLARALLVSMDAGVRVHSLSRVDADFLDPRAVAAATMLASGADVVVNATAYTSVDKAESEEALAYRINAESVGALAQACRVRGLPLIHISTNYVFNGEMATPYVEDDPADPLNAYGRTKLAGEEMVRAALDRHAIVRTSWLYSAHGSNFVRTMLRLGAARGEVRVVDDQYGAPTSAASLAAAIIAMAKRIVRAPSASCFGTFHYTNSGEATWHTFAQAIFAQPQWAGIKANVIPVSAVNYRAAAQRPRNGRLACAKIEQTYTLSRPRWQDELSRLAEAGLVAPDTS
jgi:dTDP-4-dehydrorhamnose reductase